MKINFDFLLDFLPLHPVGVVTEAMVPRGCSTKAIWFRYKFVNLLFLLNSHTPTKGVEG